jgi:peptidoglycan-associated lipoprotein
VTNAMVYIVEPKTTIDAVARQFKMSKEEIKKLNGLSGDQLQPYTPLRVRRTEEDNVIATASIKASDVIMPGALELRPARYGRGAAPASDMQEGADSPTAGINTDIKDGYYTVEVNNTLFSIAKAFNISVDELLEMNNLKQSQNLKVGQKLKVRK